TIAKARKLISLYDQKGVARERVLIKIASTQVYLTAASQVGVPPERCFVVEDAPAGLEGAHSAGMWSVGVSPNGKHLTADVVVPSRRLISSRQTPLKPFWTVLRASARSARPVPGGASGSTWFRFHRGLWTSWKEAEETGIGYQVVGI